MEEKREGELFWSLAWGLEVGLVWVIEEKRREKEKIWAAEEKRKA